MLEAMACGTPVVVGPTWEDGAPADRTLGATNRARAEAEFAEADMVVDWRDLFAGLARGQ